VTIAPISNCTDTINGDTETPDTPETPDMPDIPETPDSPDTTEMPDTTDENRPQEPVDTDESVDTTLKIYPNPTTERIFVKTGQGEILRFQLFSLRGTLVQEVVPQRENRDTYFMDVVPLQSGVYSLHIITAKTNALRQVIIK